MNKLRKIADYLTVFRFVGAVYLIFMFPQSIGFFVIYFACGLSDILDGFFARKSGIKTSYGATLDSLADLCFVAVVIIKYLQVVKFSLYIWALIVFVLLVKISSMVVGYFRFKTYTSLHTYLNKLTGFVLFCFPLIKIEFSWNVTAIIILVVAIVSAIEELIIILKIKKYEPNIKSLKQVFA